MTTCRDVIKDAMVWRGVLDAGLEPDAGEAASGMTALRGVYGEVIKAAKLRDVVITAAYTARENERIANTSDTPDAITLPVTVKDCDHPNRQRAPRDRSVIVVAGATIQSFFYDAELGQWINVQALQLTDPAPLSGNLLEGLTGRLALALRYPTVPVDPLAATAAAFFRSTILGRWDVERPVTTSEYF